MFKFGWIFHTLQTAEIKTVWDSSKIRQRERGCQICHGKFCTGIFDFWVTWARFLNFSHIPMYIKTYAKLISSRYEGNSPTEIPPRGFFLWKKNSQRQNSLRHILQLFFRTLRNFRFPKRKVYENTFFKKIKLSDIKFTKWEWLCRQEFLILSGTVEEL